MEFLGFVGLNNLKVWLSTSRPDTPTVQLQIWIAQSQDLVSIEASGTAQTICVFTAKQYQPKLCLLYGIVYAAWRHYFIKQKALGAFSLSSMIFTAGLLWLAWSGNE